MNRAHVYVITPHSSGTHESKKCARQATLGLILAALIRVSLLRGITVVRNPRSIYRGSFTELQPYRIRNYHRERIAVKCARYNPELHLYAVRAWNVRELRK